MWVGREDPPVLETYLRLRKHQEPRKKVDTSANLNMGDTEQTIS